MSSGFHHRDRRPRRSSSVARWLFFGGSALLALVLVVLGREPAPPGDQRVEPPPPALGRWTTSDERYADRAFVVEPSTVTLELGPGVPDDAGPISAVYVWEEGANTVVRLEYTTVDGEQEVEMILEPPDHMRLRNPPEVLWTRRP